ncbi:MAG: alpha/beta fold hydrolase [Oceanococcaceae bacterium]
MAAHSDALALDGSQAILGPNPIVGFRPRDVLREGLKAAGLALRQPRRTGQVAQGLLREWAKVVQGQSTLQPSPQDPRFADPGWMESASTRRVLQAYLAWVQATGRWAEEQVELSAFGRARLEYLRSLVNDAIAPSNFPIHPAALRRYRETGGQSARDGFQHFLRDLIENNGLPSQVDKSQFAVGGNLALSAGGVVYRSDVLELIQYAPSTAQVRQIPLLIVPPQINKFYLFDLSPQKSVIKALVDQGFTVFAISWRNPTRLHADWGLAEYSAAIEMAVSAICHIGGQSKVNVVGACAGGITLAAFVAARRAVGDERIQSLTLLVNVLDTTALGDTALGLFASPRIIESVRRRSQRQGVLDGKDLASSFAWLRPNDLIWNYWVNNVLLGQKPPAFDILYWNSDTTRLPARLHGEFIDLYTSAGLTRPGAVRLQGVPVDLANVDCDNYLVAGTTDHITPWKACYRNTQLLGGQSTFVLSHSGHIQSILNPPPGGKKAEFFTGNAEFPSAEEWREGAERYAGSWWPHWHDWLRRRSGEQRPAPAELGNGNYPVQCPAPGRYVLE